MDVFGLSEYFLHTQLKKFDELSERDRWQFQAPTGRELLISTNFDSADRHVDGFVSLTMH